MQCVNVALLFFLGHYLETVDAVQLYSFQGLFFFLTCSTFCRRPRRRTLSSGCTVTGSRLSQGSSPASQVPRVKNTPHNLVLELLSESAGMQCRKDKLRKNSLVSMCSSIAASDQICCRSGQQAEPDFCCCCRC